MRSVWFVLMTTVSEVEACLAATDCERLTGRSGYWNYPIGLDAALYMTCHQYAYDKLPEEDADVLRWTQGRVPAVEVFADVSGRIPGDTEVRFLAEVLLSRFEGFAFDDFLGYDHGWTLDEIRANVIVNGLGFFDYMGAYRQELR
jgi:hypothetical protein